MKEYSEALRVARKITEKYGGWLVSSRDGFVIVKVPLEGKTTIIWVRSGPVTEKALRLFMRMIRGHKYERLLLVKTRPQADYVLYRDIEEKGLVIMTPKELGVED